MRELFYTTKLSPILSGDIKIIIIYLRRIGLLKNDKFCNNCNLQMNIVNYTKNKDKEAFRCIKQSCNEFEKCVSIRKDLIFENFKFCLKNGLLIIWKWLSENSQAEDLREFDVDRLVIMKFYDILRGCCVNFYEENDIKLGGSGIICQKKNVKWCINSNTTVEYTPVMIFGFSV